MNEREGFRYAGFWIRLAAFVIDTVILMIITMPLLFWIYGDRLLLESRLIHGPAELFISYIMPIAALILLWRYRSATPGKMILGLRIIDAHTGGGLSYDQSFVRFFGYIISSLPLGLGFLWIAWDRHKQAWHDKIAGTLVVRRKPAGK